MAAMLAGPLGPPPLYVVLARSLGAGPLPIADSKEPAYK
jgi:hypothetical protein